MTANNRTRCSGRGEAKIMRHTHAHTDTVCACREKGGAAVVVLVVTRQSEKTAGERVKKERKPMATQISSKRKLR